MSAGGLLATAFVALVAPLVFNAIDEFPLLLVAGLAVLALFPSPGVARPSIWVVAGTAEDVERFVPLGWSRPIPGPVLTDDFPDLLRTLRFP
jgi:hypothetical protein